MKIIEPKHINTRETVHTGSDPFWYAMKEQVKSQVNDYLVSTVAKAIEVHIRNRLFRQVKWELMRAIEER